MAITSACFLLLATASAAAKSVKAIAAPSLPVAGAHVSAANAITMGLPLSAAGTAPKAQPLSGAGASQPAAAEAGKAQADASFDGLKAGKTAAFAGVEGPPVGEISRRMFSPLVLDALNMNREEMARLDDAGLDRSAKQAYRQSALILHPDRKYIAQRFHQDPDFKRWVDTAMTAQKIPRAEAVEKLANAVFAKLGHAKHAFDLWRRQLGVGEPLFVDKDPVLGVDGADEPGPAHAPSRADAQPRTPQRPEAPDMGVDFDYLRHGTQEMRIRPNPKDEPIVRDASGRFNKSTAFYHAGSNSWFERATGTTFFWDDFYDGYVNFELGYYFIPATETSENFIYDQEQGRGFYPHINAWLHSWDLKKKILPRTQGLLGTAGPARPALGTGNSQPVAVYQAAQLESGAKPLPMNAGGRVIGFFEGDSGFGDLRAYVPGATLPRHRQSDIIDAGFAYALGLPEHRREGALRLLEAKLRMLDESPDPDRDAILKYLGLPGGKKLLK